MSWSSRSTNNPNFPSRGSGVGHSHDNINIINNSSSNNEDGEITGEEGEISGGLPTPTPAATAPVPRPHPFDSGGRGGGRGGGGGRFGGVGMNSSMGGHRGGWRGRGGFRGRSRHGSFSVGGGGPPPPPLLTPQQQQAQQHTAHPPQQQSRSQSFSGPSFPGGRGGGPAMGRPTDPRFRSAPAAAAVGNSNMMASQQHHQQQQQQQQQFPPPPPPHLGMSAARGGPPPPPPLFSNKLDSIPEQPSQHPMSMDNNSSNNDFPPHRRDSFHRGGPPDEPFSPRPPGMLQQQQHQQLPPHHHPHHYQSQQQQQPQQQQKQPPPAPDLMRASPYGGGESNINSSNIPKFRGGRDSSIFRGGGDTSNMNDANVGSFGSGGSGPGRLPRPDFAGSSGPSDLNNSTVTGPPINYRGPHRGGRRASDFMMNTSTSSGSNEPPHPPLFRGYSGSVGGVGGPRSPARGGRGGFRGGGIGRSGSFSNRSARGLGNDPRFGGGGGGSFVDPQQPPTTMSMEHDNSSNNPIPAPPLFVSGSSNNPPFAASGRTSSKPPHGSMRRAISDGEASFAGRHQWNSRTSPHASPQYHKPSIKFPGDGDEMPSPPNSGNIGPDSNITHPNKPPFSHHKQQQQQQQQQQVPLPSHPPPAPADEPPPPLLISALGEEQAKVAEKVVLTVADILHDSSLQDADGMVSMLPSKQQILSAVAKLDAKIKTAQKEAEDMKMKVKMAMQDEDEQRQKAKEEAINEAKRQTEAKLRLEEERHAAEVEAHEAELLTFVDESKSEFDSNQRQALAELEEKLRVAREEEEKKLRETLNAQMISTADDFDRDISKSKKELERATHLTKKIQQRLSNVEKDYREKLMKLELEQAGAESVDKEPVTRPTDLVSQIIAENQRKAAESHLILLAAPVDADDKLAKIVDGKEMAVLEQALDPTHGMTTAEWTLASRQVTGLADALYSEPSEAPYFAHHERLHEAIAPLVTEYVRDKQNRLRQHFTQLAHEYEYRSAEYGKDLAERRATQTKKKSTVVPVRHSIANVAGGTGKPTTSTAGSSTVTVQPILESAGVRSTNPYRRSRGRGEVRSEYEQEQILAELAAQDAMQKRIEFGGCAVPKQLGTFERQLNGTFLRTFTAQKVDMMDQERELSLSNVWTDMEKAIFLDRWLQFPKDFRKIASYLRNKTTRDCVRFYYDSKQAIPYKGILREHIMRRKRRGDYNVWDATIEAALSVGAIVEAGTSEDKPLVFYLPRDDHTYYTRKFHPMQREVFDAMVIDAKVAAQHEDDEQNEPKRAGRKPKRHADPLFVLDAAQRKYLKIQEQSPLPSNTAAATGEATIKKSRSRALMGADTDEETDLPSMDDSGGGPTLQRRAAPQKWTAAEKKIFHDTLQKDGRNWSTLADAVGTKTISQIKNYYYDYKKQGRGRAERKPGRPKGKTKLDEEGAMTPPPLAGEELSDSQPTTPCAAEETPPPPPEDSSSSSYPTGPSTVVTQPLPAQSSQEQAYEQLLTQYPHLARQFQQKQQQGNVQQYQDGSGEMQFARSFQADFERSLSRSGTSTPDPSDIWAQAQQHSLHQQHQYQSQQLSGETAGRLLQHHSQSQHQQLLSLLPWMNQSSQLSHGGSHQHQQQPPPPQPELDAQQQLRMLLEQHQQRQRQQQSQHPQQQHAQHSHHDQLAALGLSGLAGLSNQGRGMGHQQSSQQHHYPHHFSHQVAQHQQQGYGNLQQHYQQPQQQQQGHHSVQQQQPQQRQSGDPNSQQIADLAALFLLSRGHQGK